MRIFMGIVWFVVFFVVLYIIYSIIVALVISSGTHLSNAQDAMQAGLEFARDHAVLLSVCRWGIFIVSIAGAVLGTWKRVLPGTKKKIAAQDTTTAA